MPLVRVLCRFGGDPKRLQRYVVIVSVLFALCPFPNTLSAPPDDSVEPETGSDVGSLPVLPRINSATAGSGESNGRTDRILATGGWKSEVVAGGAKQQLKALGKLLLHVDQIDPTAINRIIADGFACYPLRPAKLKKSFEGGSLVIYRATGKPARLPGNRKLGPAGCLHALRELAIPLKDSDELRVHFKVFKVDVAGQTATTWAYFQFSGKSRANSLFASSSAVQQNATWICEWDLTAEDDLPRLKSIDVVEFEEVLVPSGTPKLFTDCTASVLGGNESFHSQLLFGTDHWRGRLLAEFGIGVFGPEGIAVGDVNGDGLDDLFVCQPGGLPNLLYVRQPDGSADDRTAEAGLDLLDGTSSALLVDLDNDGDQDLILGVIGKIVVLANDGDGHFERCWSHALQQIPFSLSAADYDDDGKLDFYVCVYAEGNGPFSVGSTAPLPWHDANNGGANHLFRNRGDLSFDDVTVETGLDVNNRRFSYAAAWEDYDDDGDLDLYVANDFGRNSLFRNDGGRFKDMAAEAGVEDSSAGMSVSWSDYDNDGRMDLYVSNMFSSAGNRVTFQRRFKSRLDRATRVEIQRHARGNSLFKNAGDGSFEDVGIAAGVNMGRWAWGSLFADLNNDGWDDLYVANGFVTQQSVDDL